jgi:hypothetical protein
VTIHVRIDRIVLSGIDPGNRRELIEGLREELTRTLADPSLRAARSQRTPVMRLGGLPLAPGPRGARSLGGEIGRSIGKGVQPR